MTHFCHAMGCAVLVPPKMLFCAPHWRKTPRWAQRMIWATYRSGQEVTKDPSAVYLVAQAHVVCFVAVEEGLLDADAAVERLMRTFEALVEQRALTLADLDLLARFDAETFGTAARTMREIIERREREATP